MTAILLSLLFGAGLSRAVTPWSLTINTNNVIVVTDVTYGAVGNGIFTNTTAFQNAIDAAASWWHHERFAWWHGANSS